MKKTIIKAVLAAILTLAGTPAGFYAGEAYARPEQTDSRKLNAITQKMNAMAQTLSKEYAKAMSINRSAPAPAHALKPAAGLSKEVVGYYTEDWAGDTASLQSVNTNGSKIAGIATFSYQLQANGQIYGAAPKSAIEKQRSTGGKALALIHNFHKNEFNRTVVHNVISNTAIRSQTIANIIEVVRDNGYDGVNIDFENLAGSDRANFSSFITQLSEALHRRGYLMTISVPAKTFDDKTGWGGAFDYQAIGKAADRVMLMTYDEHWFGSTPGAVASSPWVEGVIRYAEKTIPINKILLGIGTYGYDWAVSGKKPARAVSAAGALQVMSRYGAKIIWDDKAQVPYFYYKKDGIDRVVWFESNQSAAFKMDMVNRYNLAGIAIWRLGFEANGFWDTVTKKFGE
ncbi:MAG: glycosyl hydrolase family 18 protein [Thermincola sp.]|jgi:spore germination protein YaaH|nr:glycosyl hydrolase family 18 protein [Thermincola sp.]MDT3701728.1 glycosyl hydrolase family 18 protein [Thermincola sp.]